MRAGKNAARQPFALANQAEQQVLGLDGDASELTRLVTGEEENSSGTFGVPFENPAYLGENRWCCGHGNDDHIISHGARIPIAMLTTVFVTGEVPDPAI